MTVENAVNDNGVSSEDLIRLHNLGFKLIPLDKKGNPADHWTPIYDNPNYWIVERLERESYKFKNVATCFGKSHKKDEQGRELFLNCLDIDSDNVYFALFNLVNQKTSKEFSMIAEAMQRTFVTKTKKPNGFHIFWFSHKQNESISTYACKREHEFEIKTGKNGLCTLPSSTHRDDPTFSYKNYGQAKIVISDGMYDEIKKC